jgi:hypothetical protein
MSILECDIHHYRPEKYFVRRTLSKIRRITAGREGDMIGDSDRSRPAFTVTFVKESNHPIR